MPNKVLNFETPFDVFHKFFPTNRFSFSLPVKIFECTVFIHIHSHNQGKLEPRATKCAFVGYALTQKGYKRFEIKEFWRFQGGVNSSSQPLHSEKEYQHRRFDEGCHFEA